MKKTIWRSAILVLLLVAVAAHGAEWYQGGTLHAATICDWWEATAENRLATCGDLIATLHMKGALSLPITDVPSIKPYAVELVAFIDSATVDWTSRRSNTTRLPKWRRWELLRWVGGSSTRPALRRGYRCEEETSLSRSSFACC